MLPAAVYGALSATTANTIEGSEPYFVLNGTPLLSTNELLGFIMPDGAGGQTQVTRTGTTQVVNIVGSIQFKDIKLLVPANNTTHSLNTVAGLVIDDDEGDAAGGVGVASGHMQAVFKDNGTVITDLNRSITACNGGPYTLTVTTTGTVKASTPFGAPNAKTYANNTVTYTLTPKDVGFCYIKPKEMTIYNSTARCGTTATGVTPSPNGNCKWEGGYNPALWHTTKGFLVPALKSSGIDYPTTGFKGASLTFIGTGNVQNVYKCDISGGAWVTPSTTAGYAANCTLTYNSVGRPTGNITVRLRTNNAAGTILDTYIIKAPAQGKWAEAANPALATGGPHATSEIPYSDTNFSANYPAAESCGFSNTLTGLANHGAASKMFFKRSELTNSPAAYTDHVIYDTGSASWQTVTGTGPLSVAGIFSRDADGSFMGEWGRVYDYSASAWSTSTGVNWTADSFSSNRQYFVGALGAVGRTDPSMTLGPGLSHISAVCKR